MAVSCRGVVVGWLVFKADGQYLAWCAEVRWCHVDSYGSGVCAMLTHGSGGRAGRLAGGGQDGGGG